MGRSIGKPSLYVEHKMPANVVVEDLLWNSLDGNASERPAKRQFFGDLLSQKGQIGEIRVQLST